MTNRNRELVPDSLSLVRERLMATGLCAKDDISAEEQNCRMKNDLKAKQRLVFDSLLNR